MALPKKFDKRLKMAMGYRGAWLPTLSELRVGSIVVLKDGFYQAVGHLDQFPITSNTRKGSVARVDIQTNGVSTKVTQGGIQVAVEKINANAETDVEFEFRQEDSFVLKTDRFQVTEMTDETKVGQAVAKLPKSEKWNHQQYRIVRNLAVGQDVTFIGSEKKNRTTKLSGSGKAVIKFLSFGASAGLNMSKTANANASILGGSGPVGIQVFRVRKNGFIVLD